MDIKSLLTNPVANGITRSIMRGAFFTLCTMADDRLKAADDRPLAGGWKSYYRTVRQQLAFGRDAWRTYIRF